MSKKRRQKIEKNLAYAREQIGRFLWKNYRLKVDVKMYANKQLTKQGMYSRSEFPKTVHEGVSVDLEYGLVTKGKKQKVLETAFREAVRIGLWRTGRPHQNGHPVFERELRKYGLPSYGSVPEMGKDLHTYQCSECKAVWVLRERKLPKTRDPEQMELLTTCCKKGFEYAGEKFYDNPTLQKIRRSRG